MSDPFLDALNAKAGTLAPASAPAVPRSIRNNNPGNIVFDPNNNWQGQVGSDGKFAIFDSPESGDRAHAKVLENYQKLHGINTIRGAISRFAPPSDGNDTQSYIDNVSKQLGVDPDAPIDLSDPTINSALRNAQQPIEAGTAMPPVQQVQADPNDPFLQAFNNATQGGNAGNAQDPALANGAPAGGIPVGPADGSGNQNGSWGVGQTLKSAGTGLAAITPLTDSLVNGRNYFSSLRDDAAGFASGALKVPETALNLGADLADRIPYGEKVAGLLRGSADKVARWGDGRLASDPNSTAYGWGKLGGEVGATLPLTEIAPLTAAANAGKAGKLASVLARYGDMALQGGAAGAALSGGKNVGQAALYGAALAPVAGAAGDILLPPALKAVGAISEKAKGLAGKLSARAADEVAPATSQTIRKATDLPIGDIEITHHGQPFAPKADTAPAIPASATPQEMAAALGSRGSNSGLEATAQLPKEAALHVDRLRMQGVPLDQAVREAEVSYVGAKPTVATVSRNPADQAAVWEGAKQPTPEGRALAAQIAQNNAAVVSKAQKFIQDNGGVPAQGEAAETAAVSLAKASDAAKARVAKLYEGAAAQGGEAKVSAAPLNEVFSTPEAKAPVTSEGRAFVSGMRRQIAALSDNGAKPLTAADLERLRQTANNAYDPAAAKEVNSLVGQFKEAIDARFDELGNASDAYKAARAAHREWAQTYDAPEGISGLIKRDAQGNFTNADNWRKAEGLIGATADKPFVQIVNQLQANGDTAALKRLKASVLQRAYERATGNATDKLGNSTLNGKLFFGELNKIGTTKLNALFSPDELAEIATTGRAAIHLNEAVPGTNNTSNTASALAKALAGDTHKGNKLKTGLRIAGHVAGAATGHFGGNIAVEGIHKGAGYLTERGRTKALAEALRDSMSPAKVRAANAAKAKRTAEILRRRAAARKITNHAAPIIGAQAEGKR